MCEVLELWGEQLDMWCEHFELVGEQSAMWWMVVAAEIILSAP